MGKEDEGPKGYTKGTLSQVLEIPHHTTLAVVYIVRCSAVEPFPNEVYKVIITTGYHYSHVPCPCDCETSLIQVFYFSIPRICVKKIWIKDVLPPICI